MRETPKFADNRALDPAIANTLFGNVRSIQRRRQGDYLIRFAVVKTACITTKAHVRQSRVMTLPLRQAG
jgi:hypothetical protein